MPGNEDAERIYFIVQDQILPHGGFSRSWTINHVAIHEAMKLYGVKDKVDCFEKVVSAYRAVAKEEIGKSGN